MISRVGYKIAVNYEAVIDLVVDGKDPDVTADVLVEVNIGAGQEPAIVRLNAGDGSLVVSTFHTSAATSAALLAVFEEVIWAM